MICRTHSHFSAAPPAPSMRFCVSYRKCGRRAMKEKTPGAPFDVVGHLIHAERTDWMPRVRMVLQFGEAQTFAPFDRWGMARETQGKSLGQLLDEFAQFAIREPGAIAGLKSAARRPSTAWPASCSWSSYSIRAAGHLGNARLNSFASDLAGHGPPVPRSCGPVERIPRRAAVRRAQLLIGNAVVI